MQSPSLACCPHCDSMAHSRNCLPLCSQLHLVLYSPRAIYVYLHDSKMGVLAPRKSQIWPRLAKKMTACWGACEGRRLVESSGDTAAMSSAHCVHVVVLSSADGPETEAHRVVLRGRSGTRDWSVALGSEIMATLVKKDSSTFKPRCPQLARLYFTHMPRGAAHFSGRRLQHPQRNSAEEGASSLGGARMCAEADDYESAAQVCRIDPCGAWGGDSFAVQRRLAEGRRRLSEQHPKDHSSDLMPMER